MERYTKMVGHGKVILITLSVVLTLIMCAACSTQQSNNASDNKTGQSSTEESGLDFDLPEDYEETAKQFASNFTVQWALAYRSNEGHIILERLLDDYADMIDGPRNDIVTAWNNSQKTGANAWYIYVSGPTVSSVMVKDNKIENNAVHLTIDVSLMGTAQLYSTLYWGTTGESKSVSDQGTYEVSYDTDGWHFNSAKLKLS